MEDLFPSTSSARSQSPPLAERLRPGNIEDIVGQQHLLAPGAPLRVLLVRGEIPSMIFWAPPGVGKTTLARIIAGHLHADFHQLNAVSAGVKDVRTVIARAQQNLRGSKRRTILFIDEIHRFNKAQQDALLHAVEDGTLTLIGATTENPSFEVISPLLSRCQVYTLQPLPAADLRRLVERALAEDPIVSRLKVTIEDLNILIAMSGGDARKLLNALETGVSLSAGTSGESIITVKHIEQAYQRNASLYDKNGEQHYDIISAFIKSLRGCDPDGALYWLARMIEGGEEPKFIARRMIILASEDIGNADPYALTLAMSCFHAIDIVGMPEGRIVMAHTATYLAAAPKSNASYHAIDQALEDAAQHPNLPVPLHIRNAPTALMKELGYGDGYMYGHDHTHHFAEQQYLPDMFKNKQYYHPSDEGAEKKLRDRLRAWWKSRKKY